MQLDKIFKSSAGYIIGIPFYAVLNLCIALEYLFNFSKRKLMPAKKSEHQELYPVPYHPTHSELDVSIDIYLGCLPDKINEVFSYTISETIPANANLILLELIIPSPEVNIYEEREYNLTYDNGMGAEDFFLFLSKLGNSIFDDKINSYRLWIRIPSNRSIQVEMKNKISNKSYRPITTEIKIISYK